ncbi:hypothetical protein M0811_09726 [Anaeramoeba ignava]|uniref:Beta-amylase n=1 Tax=Anaeramoeba ignava TaxID=1746090 RepID=A0A9Q0LFV4_ANAIG|nr:hypothetical protein M0811_09726 [Anaeramoeba ignava]
MKTWFFVFFFCFSIYTFGIKSTNVPVYVMLPLDTVNNDGTLNNPTQLATWFQKLKSGNVEGVMTDVWWGIVEKEEKQYNWSAYQQLLTLVKNAGLKLQCVMSFHQCGINVGDQCYILLPPWVLSVGQSNPDIFYTDMHGHRDQEYLSLSIDNRAVLNGRTAINVYQDFMTSFKNTFGSDLGSSIVEVQVGLGPSGEMRYPSYQLQDNLWQFPGIGEFQCYDKYMLSDLQNYANENGHSDWGHAGPNNAGTYNSLPSQTGFFSDNGGDNWSSAYGDFFLTWYTNVLINHGDQILGIAKNIFGSYNMRIAAKISGVHWWYMTDSHAAELTAGYYDTINHDGYNDIASMFKKHGVVFDFTCLEMSDSSQPSYAKCGPQELVQLTLHDSLNHGVPYSGENALTCYDNDSYGRIESVAREGITAFTYLRLSSDLVDNQSNWGNFVNFVNAMHNL